MTIEEMKSSQSIGEKTFETPSGIPFGRVVFIGIIENKFDKDKYTVAIVAEGESTIKVYGWEEQKIVLETLSQNTWIMVDGKIKEITKKSEKEGEPPTRELIINPYFIKEINEMSFVDFWYAKILKSRHKNGIAFPIAPFKSFLDEHGIVAKDDGNGLYHLEKNSQKVQRIIERPQPQPKESKSKKTSKPKKSAEKNEAEKNEEQKENVTVEGYLRHLQEEGQENISYVDLLAWGNKHRITDGDIETVLVKLVDDELIQEDEDDRNLYTLNF